jgi:hypothetical protein
VQAVEKMRLRPLQTTAALIRRKYAVIGLTAAFNTVWFLQEHQG